MFVLAILPNLFISMFVLAILPNLFISMFVLATFFFVYPTVRFSSILSYLSHSMFVLACLSLSVLSLVIFMYFSLSSHPHYFVRSQGVFYTSYLSFCPSVIFLTIFLVIMFSFYLSLSLSIRLIA